MIVTDEDFTRWLMQTLKRTVSGGGDNTLFGSLVVCNSNHILVAMPNGKKLHITVEVERLEEVGNEQSY